ncbi:sigma factor-like helix-turn-helix DNA-binding protein [Nocardia sp. NPDC004750]
MSESTLSPDEARPHIVSILDDIRRQEQEVQLSKARSLVWAHDHGLPVREIAEHIGMSESGARAAIRRAKASPP